MNETCLHRGPRDAVLMFGITNFCTMSIAKNHNRAARVSKYHVMSTTYQNDYQIPFTCEYNDNNIASNMQYFS